MLREKQIYLQDLDLYTSQCRHSWSIESYVGGYGSCGDQDKVQRSGEKLKNVVHGDEENVVVSGHNTEEIKTTFH